ncbi:MAG: hypothetical protein GF310_00090 [candidate division Zixibacteria bacterium]|nr:hypothetical protein [candidate division Zixibacteria bacterium]
MEDVIVSLLEISKHLDESNLGEFDFGQLRDALLKFEEKAPGILQMRKDYRVLSNHLMLNVMSRIRALKRAGDRRASAFWEEEMVNSSRLTAQRLIEIDNRLKKELNCVLSTRPHFRRTVVENGKRSDEKNYKIGG